MSRCSARVSPRAEEVHCVYWRHRRHLPESWTSSPMLRRRHPVYIATPRTEAHTIAPCLQWYIGGVSDWCGFRRRQLNAAKTEVIWFGSEFERLHNRPRERHCLAIETPQPVESVRDLGVYLDSELSMPAHITKTTQACFFQLRRLRHVHCLLGRDVTASLVSTFMLSRLDYCNA